MNSIMIVKAAKADKVCTHNKCNLVKLFFKKTSSNEYTFNVESS